MTALLNLNLEKVGKKEKGINFLPMEEFAASAKGRILSWLLTSFRYIVIITEVVVMLAFLSRFWLDARVADLNEAIDQDSAVIESYSDFEGQFRAIQKKLGIIAEVSANQPASGIMGTITGLLPDGVTLSSISQVAGNVRLQAKATSEIDITQFVSNLDASTKFEEVTLSKLDTTDNSSFFVFDLDLTLKKGT